MGVIKFNILNILTEASTIATKKRVPMQVAPEFEIRIKELQKSIMQKQGEKVSMRDLTKEVSINIDFETLEKKLLGITDGDIKLNLDRRKR